MKHEVPDAKCHIYATRQKDFVLRRNLLYLKVMPKRSNEDVLVFVVPGLKWQAVIDGCHHYLGHQGRDRTLSLLRKILVAGHGPEDDVERPQLREMPHI